MIHRSTHGGSRHHGRAAIGLLLGVTWFLSAQGAWADNAAIAVYAEGADAAAIRELAIAALPRGSKAFDANTFAKALVAQEA